MSDIDAIRERQAVGYFSKDSLAEVAIAFLLAEVDRLNEERLLVMLSDDGVCALLDQIATLTRLGNALSDAVGSYAHTQAVEDARKAWDDEVGR